MSNEVKKIEVNPLTKTQQEQVDANEWDKVLTNGWNTLTIADDRFTYLLNAAIVTGYVSNLEAWVDGHHDGKKTTNRATKFIRTRVYRATGGVMTIKFVKGEDGVKYCKVVAVTPQQNPAESKAEAEAEGKPSTSEKADGEPSTPEKAEGKPKSPEKSVTDAIMELCSTYELSFEDLAELAMAMVDGITDKAA